jgi:hypothetical protein
MKEVDRQREEADFDLKQRFQKMIFPNGLVYDSRQLSFGTSKISPIYDVLNIKKPPRRLLVNRL